MYSTNVYSDHIPLLDSAESEEYDGLASCPHGAESSEEGRWQGKQARSL